MLNKKEIAEYFVYGKWTEADVDKAVTKGHLTAEEAEEIKAINGTEGLESFKLKQKAKANSGHAE